MTTWRKPIHLHQRPNPFDGRTRRKLAMSAHMQAGNVKVTLPPAPWDQQEDAPKAQDKEPRE